MTKIYSGPNLKYSDELQMGVQAPPQPKARSEDWVDRLFEVGQATFEENNPIGQIANHLLFPKLSSEFNPNFKLNANDLTGYEHHWLAFTKANSIDDVNVIKQRLDRQDANRGILSQTMSWPEMVVHFTLGYVANPINLINFGSTVNLSALRSLEAGRGGRLALGALRGGLTGLMSQGINESIREATQLDHNKEEAYQRVLESTTMSALLGAAATYLSPEQVNRFKFDFKQQSGTKGTTSNFTPLRIGQAPPTSSAGTSSPQPAPKTPPTGGSSGSPVPAQTPAPAASTPGQTTSAFGGSGGAMRVGPRRYPDDYKLARFSYLYQENPNILQKVLRFAVGISPAGQAAVSNSEVLRWFGANAFQDDFIRQMHLDGRTGTAALENLIEAHDENLVKINLAGDELFKQYQLRHLEGKLLPHEVGQPALDANQFFTEVTESTGMGDAHPTPEIEALAKKQRAFYDYYPERGKEVGFFQNEPVIIDGVELIPAYEKSRLVSETYNPRVPNKAKILTTLNHTLEEHGEDGFLAVMRKYLQSENELIQSGVKRYKVEGVRALEDLEYAIPNMEAFKARAQQGFTMVWDIPKRRLDAILKKFNQAALHEEETEAFLREAEKALKEPKLSAKVLHEFRKKIESAAAKMDLMYQLRHEALVDIDVQEIKDDIDFINDEISTAAQNLQKADAALTEASQKHEAKYEKTVRKEYEQGLKEVEKLLADAEQFYEDKSKDLTYAEYLKSGVVRTYEKMRRLAKEKLQKVEGRMAKSLEDLDYPELPKGVMREYDRKTSQAIKKQDKLIQEREKLIQVADPIERNANIAQAKSLLLESIQQEMAAHQYYAMEVAKLPEPKLSKKVIAEYERRVRAGLKLFNAAEDKWEMLREKYPHLIMSKNDARTVAKMENYIKKLQETVKENEREFLYTNDLEDAIFNAAQNYLNMELADLQGEKALRVDPGMTPGPFKELSNLIPDDLIKPFMIRDSRILAFVHHQTINPIITTLEWLKDHHYQTIEDIRRLYKMEMDRKLKNVDNSSSKMHDLAVERKAGLAFIDKTVNVLLGRIKKGTDYPVFDRAARFLNNYTSSRVYGMVLPNSLDDFFRALTTHGTEPILSQSMEGMKKAISDPKHAKSNYMPLYVSAMTMQRQLGPVFDDIYGPYIEKNALERWVTDAGRNIHTITFQEQASGRLEEIFARAAYHSLIENLVKVSQGLPLSEKQARLMLTLNLTLDPSEASFYVKNYFDAGGERYEETYLPSTRPWLARSLEINLRAALRKNINGTIMRPSKGDLPFWAHTVAGGLLIKLKPFQFAATNKLLIPTLSRRDRDMWGDIMMRMMVGSLSYMLNQTLKGMPISTNWTTIAGEAIDRSAMTGLGTEFYNIAAKIIGTETSRFQSRGVVAGLLGPNVGLIEDFSDSIRAMLKDSPYTTNDLSRLVRLAPYSGVWWYRYHLDMLVRQLGGKLGLEVSPDISQRR